MTPHEHDLEFIQRVREASLDGLRAMLRFQCQELWRRVAVLREIARRK